MSAVAAAVAYFLLAGAACFQGALALGAPWARCAYGGRAATDAGRLPTRLRLMSGCTVLLLAVAGYVVHVDVAPLLWLCAGLFAVNTVGNLAGKHPVERWGMSAATLALAGAYLTLGLR